MATIGVERLVRSARKAGITSPAAFESLALRLSPHQVRLFTLLFERGECDTVTVREQASIGNISECAASLNCKLEAADDPRRVVCQTRPHQNKFGERGVLGWWKLTCEQSDAAA